ncbi:MAG: acetate--CoA ligase [Thermoplasmata archaeon]|nr:acetate--CoA ligase [Thermoplasmata archaeon]
MDDGSRRPPERAAGGPVPPTGSRSADVPPGGWTVERYRQHLAESVRDIRAFWEPVARREVRWMHPFTEVLDWKPPYARWFPDGRLNASDNCLDRHIEGPNRHRVAFYWEGESGERRAITYDELYQDVNRLASALALRGFSPSDMAAIYLPMVPELPVTMLALARLGIPFTTVFSGFSAQALGDRIRDLGARVLFTADGGYRRGRVVPLKAVAEEAVSNAPSVDTVVVVRRTGEEVPKHPTRDVDWTTLLETGSNYHPPYAAASDHLLYLLYSSGTTGSPKAIAHGTGGYMVHVTATTRWVFDPQPSDVFWCAADVGWVTGHSYIIFGPLSAGLTGVLYEGAFDHPSPSRMWEMVERYRVSILYTSPTALRGLRRAGEAALRTHDRSSLRLLGTVGEAINPDVWEWYHREVGGGRCPIVDTWWQTETGGIMISSATGLAAIPHKPGSAAWPLPGIDAGVVNEQGEPTAPGEKGFVVIRQPWPGMLLRIQGNDERYRSAYWTRFPGSYYPGDYAYRDSDGYFWFLGRADEVLKVAGHRLGTIEIEDALLSYPGVAEAAVCGRADELRGEVPVAFVVLRDGTVAEPGLPDDLREHVAQRIGKIARPEEVHIVRSIPKTRSGKIMRRVVKAVAEGRADVGDLTTLEDGASVEEIRGALRSLARQLGPR